MKKFIPGLKLAIDNELSIRQLEIIKILIENEKSMIIDEIQSQMQNTSIESLQNILLKLRLKDIIIGKSKNACHKMNYSLNEEFFK